MVENVLHDGEQDVLDGFGDDGLERFRDWPPVVVQVLVGAVLEHLDALEQVAHVQPQPAYGVVHLGVGHVVEHVPVPDVQHVGGLHDDVHAAWKVGKLIKSSFFPKPQTSRARLEALCHVHQPPNKPSAGLFMMFQP